MRLYEVADRFSSDLTTILRNLLGRGNAKYSSQHLTYFALSNLMKNLGYGAVSFEDFSKIYDDHPEIQTLVSDFDQDGITLSTNTDVANSTGPKDMEAPSGGKTVDQMAHNVVSKEY